MFVAYNWQRVVTVHAFEQEIGYGGEGQEDEATFSDEFQLKF
jgi:hypothetical protein